MNLDRSGKVLKIKRGYNPNSSSIGVAISAFLKAASIGALLISTAVAILSSWKKRA